jgi:hypothetical protein
MKTQKRNQLVNRSRLTRFTLFAILLCSFSMEVFAQERVTLYNRYRKVGAG